MSSNSPRWLAALGSALLAHIVLIAATVVGVAIYSHLIAPGLSMDRYQAFAEASGPWVALTLGIPLFYLLARRLGRAAPGSARATALALLAIYLGSDLALMLAFAPLALIPWVQVALNYAAFAASAWLGANAAHRLVGVARA